MQRINSNIEYGIITGRKNPLSKGADWKKDEATSHILPVIKGIVTVQKKPVPVRATPLSPLPKKVDMAAQDQIQAPRPASQIPKKSVAESADQRSKHSNPKGTAFERIPLPPNDFFEQIRSAPRVPKHLKPLENSPETHERNHADVANAMRSLVGFKSPKESVEGNQK